MPKNAYEEYHGVLDEAKAKFRAEQEQAKQRMAEGGGLLLGYHTDGELVVDVIDRGNQYTFEVWEPTPDQGWVEIARTTC